MTVLAWIVSLLVAGPLVGLGIGALLVFTGGRPVWDLVAGQLGAIGAAGGLYLVGSDASRAPLPLLVAGLAGAVLITWLVRMVMWPPPPKMVVAIQPRPPRQGTVVMTAGDARQLWLSERKLASADRTS